LSKCEGGLAVIGSRVYVCSVVVEKANDLGVAVGGRRDKWRESVAVSMV
jgi:hypothetical protein